MAASNFKNLNKIFNWTATYRADSTLSTPYAKWVSYDKNRLASKSNTANYAQNKTKNVAMFVSNCFTSNNRLEYAKELSKFIQVDIFGDCGNIKCPKSDSKSCLEMLRSEYKFYLAFENSNCRDYITEKFYTNAIG